MVIQGNGENTCDIQVVHLVCKINMVGFTPINECKNVLKNMMNASRRPKKLGIVLLSMP